MTTDTHPLHALLSLFNNSNIIYLPTIFGIVKLYKRTVDNKILIEMNRGALYCEIEVTPKDYIILYGSDEADNLINAVLASASKNLH